MLDRMLIDLAERGWLPDRLLRAAIRRLCGQRLREEAAGDAVAQAAALSRFVAELKRSPIALVPEKANEQHYELPPEFFQQLLGPRLKYSCCFWPTGTKNLADAELRSLELVSQRAELADGQQILELGCGWGSLSLWMAERFPAGHVTAVSNSTAQGDFIRRQASERGLRNLTAATADINYFNTADKFDRVVSVEMFEHLRNYEQLLERVASWLQPAGKLFVHVFSHRTLTYAFETTGPRNWMGRYFFSGGLMPSHDLLPHFQTDLQLTTSWQLAGLHYQRTADAWLENLDRNRNAVLRIFAGHWPPNEARLWLHRWRLFLLAVSELFGYRAGQEWGVSHYLFEPKPKAKCSGAPCQLDAVIAARQSTPDAVP